MTTLRLTLAALSVVSAFAAQPQPPAGPIFRSGTHLVEVEVVVRDKNGPINGLTREDFTVLDQGKPQPIAVFTLPRHPKPARSPGTVSNRANLNPAPPSCFSSTNSTRRLRTRATRAKPC